MDKLSKFSMIQIPGQNKHGDAQNSHLAEAAEIWKGKSVS
jgi:hypothetical protein